MNTNNKSSMSSLQKVTGYNRQQIEGLKVIHPLAKDENGQVDNSRSVVIQKDRLMLSRDIESSFEYVVQLIAGVIAARRTEVENALIVTGSPISIRQANPKKFNALVQNRLSQKDEQGDAFRQLMSALIVAMYERQINQDRFFVLAEDRAGAVGELSMETQDVLSLPTKPASPLSSGANQQNILPYQKTPDGGVEQTKPTQDWGGILSGSAQVINAVGGVIGLFAGAQPTQDGFSALDPYGTGVGAGATDQRGTGGKGWVWGIVVLVIIGVVIAVVMNRKK